jgi:hypothetical protein
VISAKKSHSAFSVKIGLQREEFQVIVHELGQHLGRLLGEEPLPAVTLPAQVVHEVHVAGDVGVLEPDGVADLVVRGQVSSPSSGQMPADVIQLAMRPRKGATLLVLSHFRIFARHRR